MLRCPFCTASVPDPVAAMQAGWIPSYFDGDDEVSDPVCNRCVEVRLQQADDGEFELAVHALLADEAQAAERGGRWRHAVALWQTAADKCPDPALGATYTTRAKQCRDGGE
ncbi:MAG: hypothetical protein AB7U20_14305 [Planctomycetaceae bacterium]